MAANAKRKGSNGMSFLAHEVKVLAEFDLPVVIANHDADPSIADVIPHPLLDAEYYTVSASFQPKIIRYALDNYAAGYAASSSTGCHY